jgi:hypothetical protein
MEKEAQASRAKLYAEAMGMYGTDPNASAQILMQDPATMDAGLKLGTSYADEQRKNAFDLQRAETESASKNAQWERDAALKRELAAMRSGSISVDPETGEMVVSPQPNTGSYDPTPVAQKLGVPAQPLDTRGLSPKDSSMYAKQTRLNAEKSLQNDDAQAAMGRARSNIADTKRFDELSQIQKTGGLSGMIANTPFVGGIVRAFDPELSEMKSIQDRLTPQQRVAGSGATSDFDARMFQSAVMGVNKPAAANANITKAMRTKAQDELAQQQFMNDFLAANGHVNGADKAWQQYLDANPIFDPTATPESIKLNPARKTYQEFFGSQQPAQPTQAASKYKEGQTATGKDGTKMVFRNGAWGRM